MRSACAFVDEPLWPVGEDLIVFDEYWPWLTYGGHFLGTPAQTEVGSISPECRVGLPVVSADVFSR